MSEVSVSEKRVKEPLVKISKRDGHKWYHSVLLNVGAVATALIIGGIFIAALGYNPFTFYAKIIVGNFSNAYYLRALVAIFVPLLITALGLSAAFKMKLWNIGAEGQFVMGALTATTVALLLNDSLPRPWGVIIVGAAGAAGGGLYGMLVAVFKAKFNTNETLLTLMLNYIAVYIVQYFEKTDFFKRASNGIPAFKRIDEAVWLTKIQIGNFYFDTALIIAVVLTVGLFIYFKYTKHGYEISVAGDSLNTAKYAGMKTNRIIIRTMFLSAAIIGLAGSLTLTGASASHTMSAGISSGVGWTAIIVAWLAKLNPASIVLSAVLMSMLEQGSGVARSAMGISLSAAQIIQGVILFSVLAFDFLLRYKVTFRFMRNKNPDGAAPAVGEGKQ